MFRSVCVSLFLVVSGASITLAQEVQSESVADVADSEVSPDPDDRIAALEAQCEASAEARDQRQAEKSLFERLGGEEKIQELSREVMRLHLQNPDVKHFFESTDTEQVAYRTALFIIAGTGGPPVYQDRPDLTTMHKPMKLTNADFLAAGADVIEGMKNQGYGENEINDVVCTLIALRALVVLPPDKAAADSVR